MICSWTDNGHGVFTLGNVHCPISKETDFQLEDALAEFYNQHPDRLILGICPQFHTVGQGQEPSHEKVEKYVITTMPATSLNT